MKLLLSLFLLFTALSIYSQPAGSVTYNYYKDPIAAEAALNKLKNDKPEVYALHGQTYRDMDLITRQLEFELNFNGSRALWQLVNSTPPEDPEKAMNHRLAVIIATQARTDYYVDLEKKERLYRTNLDGALVNVRQQLQPFSWSFTGKTKQWGGYELYEAITTEAIETSGGKLAQKEIHAWYAPDIPVPYGPAGYDGLPGLVLEVRFGPEQNIGFQATTISIGNAGGKLKPIKKPKAVATMEAQDYEERVAAGVKQLKKN